MDPYKTIEEVWDWRKKAYGKLDKLPIKKRVAEINKIGRKYASRLKLKTVHQELVNHSH